jgi:molecular chaperone GrpE (heat shock protein)
MAKNFGKTIGEQPTAAEPSTQPPAAAAEPPAQKTWRDEEPPANLTKKAHESWQNYKAKAIADVEARDARIKTLETEVAEAKKSVPTAQAEVEQLRQQLAQTQSIVERVAIERSPLFKSKVIDQEDLVRARLGKVTEGTGLTEQDLNTLLTGNLSARENVLETKPITSFRKTQIIDLLSKWDDVAEERGRMLEHGKESLAEFIKQQQDVETSRRAQYMAECAKVFEEQQALCHPKLEPYQPIEGNEDWNRNVTALKAASRRIYDGSVDRATLAQVAILAPAAMVYQQLFQGAQKRITELEAQVKGLRGVAPTVRDRGADIPTPNSPAPALSSPNGDFVKDIVGKFQKLTGMQ